jgi:ABC-2 type transport system permease protein
MRTLKLIRAFLHRDWVIARSYRFQFLLDATWWFFQLSLYYALGKIVDSASMEAMDAVGDDYFAFVVIGLAMVEFVNRIFASFATVIRTEQTTGSLEALLMTPRLSTLIVFGSGSYEFVRGLVQMVVFVTIGVVVFGLRFTVTPQSAAMALLVLGATLILFAAVGLMTAAAVIVAKQAAALLYMLSFVIAVMGGVYVPVEFLPGPLSLLGQLFPFAWSLELLREALLHGSTDPLKFAALLVVAVLLVPIAVWVLNRALDRARSQGSLAQY